MSERPQLDPKAFAPRDDAMPKVDSAWIPDKRLLERVVAALRAIAQKIRSPD